MVAVALLLAVSDSEPLVVAVRDAELLLLDVADGELLLLAVTLLETVVESVGLLVELELCTDTTGEQKGAWEDMLRHGGEDKPGHNTGAPPARPPARQSSRAR